MRYIGGLVLDDAEIRIIAQVFRIGLRSLRYTDGSGTVYGALQAELDSFAQQARSRAHSETAKPDGEAIVAGSLTTAQAAAVLGLSRQRTRALCRSGDLIAWQAETGWRISADSAEALAAARREE